MTGETTLLCQKKNQWSGHAKTNGKGYRPPRKRASLCAKRWSIFAKVNMGRAHPSRRSRSVCPKRAGLESNYPRPNAARSAQSVGRNGIWRKDAKPDAENLPGNARARRAARSSGRAGARRQKEHCRATPNGSLDSVRRGRVLQPRKRLPERGNAGDGKLWQDRQCRIGNKTAVTHGRDG